jgi:ankyrin repeat protein
MGKADASVGTSNVTRLLEPDSVLLFQTTSWLHGHDTANHTLPQASMLPARARAIPISMEHSYSRSGKSPASSSSASPGPFAPSAQSTPRLEEPPRKQRRATQEGSLVGQHDEHVAESSASRDHPTIGDGESYADRRYRDHFSQEPSQEHSHTVPRRTSRQPRSLIGVQHGGIVAENSIAQDNARVHYGDNYYHENTRTSVGDVEQLDIAKAMKSLSFAHMNTRRDNIPRTHPNTCEWIFDQPEYLNWRKPELISEHYGFLWIKAKPGSGKSTMMKFLLNSAKKQLPSDTTISFFFHARGDQLQKSLEGMYRSLLHQLLTAFPQLRLNLETLRISHTAPHTWSVDSLHGLFHDAVLSLEDVRLTCFIDALDECPEDEIRHLVDALGDLSHSAINKKVNFHVCFASRHYPYITMQRCQHLTLDGQEGHEQDISGYVINKLAGEGKVMSDLRIEVQARSQGVFLWAVLVVQILNKEHDRGSNAHQLRRRLNETPSGLHELFQDILQRGMQDDASNEYSLHILQWVLYAQRPLSPEELYFAVHSNTPDTAFLEPWNPHEVELRTISLFILNSSKGLTEVAPGWRGQKGVVQFIHESVRDYLQRTGFGTLSPSLDAKSEALAHNYLYRSCSILLASEAPNHPSILLDLPTAYSKQCKALRSTVSTLFPFLEYSASNIVYHAEMAQSDTLLQQSHLETFPLYPWIRINNLFAKNDGHRYATKAPSKASVFARKDAQKLLSIELSGLVKTFSLDETESALGSAFMGDSPEAFAMILEHMNRFRVSVTKAENPSRLDERLEWRLKTMESWNKHDVEAARLLFEHIRGQPTVCRNQYNDYFIAAAEINQVGILCLMLDHLRHIAPMEYQASVVKALHSAAREGNEEIMQLLVTELDGMQKSSHATPISPSDLTLAFAEACELGLTESVALLLELGANIDAAHAGRIPLIRAIESSHLSTVQFLMDKGANVTLYDIGQRTALSLACSRGYDTVVQALLERDAELDCKDGSSNSPLHLACSGGHEQIVRMLVDKGAYLEARSALGWYAAHSACGNGHESTVRIQIGQRSFHGAAGDCFGNTPLHEACKHGHESIVRTLLANGANVDPSMTHGYYDDCTPLSLACEGDHLTIVQLLLERGADTIAPSIKASRYTPRVAEWLRHSGAPLLED